jgi:hypothetical protein
LFSIGGNIIIFFFYDKMCSNPPILEKGPQAKQAPF